MLRFLRRLVLILIVFTILALIVLRLAAWLRESSSADALAPDTGQFIETSMGRIFTQSAGPEAGQPILLAHGTAAWSGFWAKEVTLLGAIGPYRATAFDMPPFGLSDRPKDPDYSRVTQANRILALVDTFEQTPIMVAHSFGAAAATEAHRRNGGENLRPQERQKQKTTQTPRSHPPSHTSARARHT